MKGWVYLSEGLVSLVNFKEFSDFLAGSQTLRRQFLLQKHEPID